MGAQQFTPGGDQLVHLVSAQREAGGDLVQKAPQRPVRHAVEAQADEVRSHGALRGRQLPGPGLDALLRLLQRGHVVAVQLDVGDRVQRVLDRGGAARGADAQGRVRGCVDRDEGDALRHLDVHVLLELPRAADQLDGVEHGAQTQVVGDAAIDELRIAVAHLVVVGFVVANDHGQVGVVGIALARGRQPGGGAARAAAVVLDDHRIEDHRHRAGRGHGPRQREAVEVRAQQVEVFLAEGEALARRQVGRVDEDQRRVLADQVAEGGLAEQVLLVVRHRGLGAVVAAEPLQRVEQAAQQGAFDVAPQEPRLEVLEEAVAVEAVVGRGEAAAGDRTDDVDRLQQAALGTLQAHAGVAQFLHHAVGQRGRARAAAGKRHRQRQLVRALVQGAVEGFQRVAGPVLPAQQGLVVDDTEAGAGAHQNGGRQRRGPQGPGLAAVAGFSPVGRIRFSRDTHGGDHRNARVSRRIRYPGRARSARCRCPAARPSCARRLPPARRSSHSESRAPP